MPSGAVHSAATVSLALGAGLVAHYNGLPDLPVVTALSGGVLAGLLLSPDLDVNAGSISNQHARKIFGGIFGMIWFFIWRPYSWIIPHRSPLSHFPLLGTVIRLGYLVAIVWLILALFHLTGLVSLPAIPAWWPWSFAGLAGADALHFVMDQFLRN